MDGDALGPFVHPCRQSTEHAPVLIELAAPRTFFKDAGHKRRQIGFGGDQDWLEVGFIGGGLKRDEARSTL